MKKISLSSLKDLFAEIAKNQALYLPVEQEDKSARFEPWEEAKTVSLLGNTVRSAKDFFFPQTENLVDFKMKGQQIEIVDSSSPVEDFVVFGVRACDARSFEILDKVFLSDPVDSYYKNRREHGTIVTLACNRPTETCFCRTFGIDGASPEGDVACWMNEDALLLEAKSEKGEKLLASIGSILSDGDAAEAETVQSSIRTILDKLPLKDLNTEKFDGKDLMETFNDPKWAELSQSCLACGTCTFVCPTCQCYDIRDYDTGHGIKRFRCWDSCMYSDFTLMAHGNNRNSQLERFRQRFMHKLIYFPQNNQGTYGCVGCGRCLSKCPISMNIVKVMKALGGKENEE
jgi:ferredoxin